LTASAAIIFMATSMILAYIASHDSSDALEKFGSEQAELARQKEEAKEKALQEGSAGSASPTSSEGGASVMEEPAAPTDTPATDTPATDTPATDTPAGSAAPAAPTGEAAPATPAPAKTDAPATKPAAPAKADAPATKPA